MSQKPRTITWLHLSDLHIQAKRDFDKVTVLDSLLSDVAAGMDAGGPLPDFIIISGDIAFAGRSEEYVAAGEFLERLLKTTRLSKKKLFVVPGNHDVDRDAVSTVERIAASQAQNERFAVEALTNPAIRAQLMRRLDHFGEFVNLFLSNKPPFSAEQYYFVRQLRLQGRTLAILGLNSAWLAAGGPDDQGRVMLGEVQVREALSMSESADLRIAIMHHGFDHLTEWDAIHSRRLLLDQCQFVLHGHTHGTRVFQAASPNSDATVIAAGAAYETKAPVNSYNIVQLNLDSGRGRVYLRTYSHRRGGFWAPDTLSYRNAPEGMYEFALPKLLVSDRALLVPSLPTPPSLQTSGIRQERAAARVFLSYAREDEDRVRGLYGELSRVGFRPWMAAQDILPGEDWQRSIQRAIRNSDVLLACLSRTSTGRTAYLQKEIQQALEAWQEALSNDVHPIPVRLDDCDIPDALAQFQEVDLHTEGSFFRLVEAINSAAKRRGIDVAQGVEPEEREEEVPPGMSRVLPLRGHTDVITRIAWSPAGTVLATPSLDKTVRLWNTADGQLLRTFSLHGSGVFSVAWSPSGELLASGDDDGTILLWSADGGELQLTLEGHAGRVECLSWSPDGHYLASASADGDVRVWATTTGELVATLHHSVWVNSVCWSPDGRRLVTGSEDNNVRLWAGAMDSLEWVSQCVLKGHTDWVIDVVWSPDGSVVASASNDLTIRVWDPDSGRELYCLEGHTGHLRGIAFSPSGDFLVSKSQDQTVRLWRCDNWKPVAVFREATQRRMGPTPGVAFHPSAPMLAVVAEDDKVVWIWSLDTNTMLGRSKADVIEHINAKVVLLGDGSVGKSGLGIRIAEGRFQTTLPTHGAQFWQIPVRHMPGLPSNVNAEFTLWDLAGQADYRLIHALFLEDASAALVLFDASDPSRSFRGVHYWAMVLNHNAPPDAFKLLVAARCDICPVTMDIHEIHHILIQCDFDGFISTSAQTGQGVDELEALLANGIKWDTLPRTTSPRLFHHVRELLLEQKTQGLALVNVRGIFNEVQLLYPSEQAEPEQVNTVVDLLQSQGLVSCLKPTPNERWVLLRPELINQYASSIVQAARTHPLGIGAVPEHEVAQAKLPFAGVDRLDWQAERTVLEAVVEMLIRNNLCFREVGLLVFPSQINITRPDPDPEHPRTEITYRFLGSLETIYASLVVRLCQTRHFQREDQWKYAAEFARNGHRLGFAMRQVQEGLGELEIYFYPDVTDYDRVTFINFIKDHLLNREVELEEQIRIYCPKCGKEVENRDAIAARVRAGRLDIPCQYCPDDTKVMIPMSIEELYRQDHSYLQKQRELAEAATEQTRRDVEELKVVQRQYAGETSKMIHILHFSDIHLGTSADATKYLTQLETDLRRELEIQKLEYLVLSGDAGDYATPEEYQAAFELVDGVLKRFGLDPSRVVIVPGNHDLNWDLAKQAYDFQWKTPGAKPLPEGAHIPAGEQGDLVRNDAKYRQRFAHFSEHFYKRIYSGQTYPTEYADQVLLTVRPDDCILFLGLNSAWQIDHYNCKRAGIYMNALSSALNQLHDHRYNDWLKIAVFHHPVAGRQMMNDEFMELLAVNGFQICMHGHVHEAMDTSFKYDDARGIRVIGAGTFGAAAKDQVAGVPLQYNLLELDKAARKITVRTRRKEKPDGAWMADARWGDKKKDPKAWYEITLKEGTFGGGCNP